MNHIGSFPSGYFFRTQFGSEWSKHPTSCKELALKTFIKTGEISFVLPLYLDNSKVDAWLHKIHTGYCPIEWSEYKYEALNGLRFFKLRIKNDPKSSTVYDMVLFLIKMLFNRQVEYDEHPDFRHYKQYSRNTRSVFAYQYLIENFHFFSSNNWKRSLNNVTLDLNAGILKDNLNSGLFTTLYHQLITNQNNETYKFFNHVFPKTCITYDKKYEKEFHTWLRHHLLSFAFYDIGFNKGPFYNWIFHEMKCKEREVPINRFSENLIYTRDDYGNQIIVAQYESFE